MSFHTLQELNLDAARYRWLRDNCSWLLDTLEPISPEWLDKEIDERLARDE